MPICEDRICPLLWGILHYRQWGSCYSGSKCAEYIRDWLTNCNVYGPLSMEQRGSEFDVIRRKMSLDCCLCSCSTCSVCRRQVTRRDFSK
jgi:hypothetical protein